MSNDENGNRNTQVSSLRNRNYWAFLKYNRPVFFLQRLIRKIFVQLCPTWIFDKKGSFSYGKNYVISLTGERVLEKKSGDVFFNMFQAQVLRQRLNCP